MLIMILQAINFIKSRLNSAGVTSETGNIGEIVADGGAGHANDHVIISLINIEENRISRDPHNYIRTETSINKKNPAIHLNITILFTSVRHETGYERSLEEIEQVISFFQKQNVFDSTTETELSDAGIEKLIFEMLSFNLEQLYQLWSMLGGRYHPSAAYRMRMVTIDNASREGGPMITDIRSDYYLKS
ncbi:MAG: DUF4255 domain-containing protein [Terrimonas sp.]|nr:DUF4255 domain-containing protein [Terrimonas sp.]OJY93260.1 MAG: hypothetical protein BGP13_16635 [Sphingobacteriales bacterium 40-81]